MNERPLRTGSDINLALHVWLDAPGIWDELVHLTDPVMGFSPELVEAATFLMGRSRNDIELVGWHVLEDDAVWTAINRSLRASIVEIANALKSSPDPVVSSSDGQTST